MKAGEFSKQLSAIRKVADVSQKYLGSLIGREQSEISAWERGLHLIRMEEEAGKLESLMDEIVQVLQKDGRLAGPTPNQPMTTAKKKTSRRKRKTTSSPVP